MWWLRRPTRGAEMAGPAGNRRPNTGAVLVVGLVAVVLGVFLPVLGVSLLAFLLADAMWMHYRSRRTNPDDASGIFGTTIRNEPSATLR